MPVSARQCAAEVLRAVIDEKRPLDEALARHEGLAALEPRDRNFARLMVMTVLRRRGQIDALLAQMLEKPLAGRTTGVMHCLRLGAAQLLWMDTPPHAAVHAMVELVAAMGHERMKGLVNAVLKRVARDGAALIAAQDEAALALPGWIHDSWREAYGELALHAMVTAALAEPALDLTVKSDPAHWAEILGGDLLPTGTVRLRQAGRIEQLPGFEEGKWWVQDAAAALPVGLLGDVRGKSVLDLCAAPGGKTAQLAARGARVTAVDKSPRRLAVLARNMERLRLEVETVEADIHRWKPDRPYDAVLLDAPCTATGTLRRHPEVLWHKTRKDVEELARLQKRLLSRVAGWLRPGGLLLYCVCSLQPEEGELQAEAFARTHPEYAAVTPPRAWQALGICLKNQAIRTHPALLTAEGGLDGFYAICWRRLNDH